MSHPGAIVIILPQTRVERIHDPDWDEQHRREVEAKRSMREAAPPRTRPLVVVDNGRRPSR